VIDRVRQPKRDGPAGFVAILSPNSKAYEEGVVGQRDLEC